MAHPDRSEFIPYLLEKLGEDTPVVYDRKNDLWDTCRRAWQAHDRECTFGVVIQDDAIVCDNFRERAEEILADTFCDDQVYSFYVGKLLKDRVEKAKKAGIDHVLTRFIANEVAICMRTKYIDRMIEWCDERNAKNDQEISRWARMAKLPIFYPIPGLINHRDCPSIYRANRGLDDKIREATSYEE